MSRHSREQQRQRAIVEAVEETAPVEAAEPVAPKSEPVKNDSGWRVTVVCAVCGEPFADTVEHSTARREGRCQKCGSANFRETVEPVG